MGNYIICELRKLIKWKLTYVIGICFLVLLTGVILKNINNLQGGSGIFVFIYAVLSYMSMYFFIYQIMGVIFSTKLLASDIEDRTFLYYMIKPVSHIKILFSKCIASFIFVITSLLITIFASTIVGMIYLDTIPFNFKNKQGITILKDAAIIDSTYRISLYTLSIIIGAILAIIIGTIISLILKKLFWSIVTSTLAFLIAEYPISIQGKFFSISTYQMPIYLIEKPINEYISLKICEFSINIIILIVLFVFSYVLMEKLIKKL